MKKIHVSLALRIIIMTLILLGFGLIMIYSASVSEGAQLWQQMAFRAPSLKWAGLDSFR